MSSIESSDLTKKSIFSQNSIETIDGALLDYVEKLNVHCNTSNGWTKVPVIWSSAERSYQIKNNPYLRDKNGTLIAPIISIERTNITKDPNKKGSYQANLSPKQDRYYSTKVLNQDKTSNFANADTYRKTGQLNFKTSKKNKKQVFQHTEIRIPVYITIQYKINIMTNYQVQMNEIMQPFITKNAQNYFLIEKDGYRFECFMEPEFAQESVANLSEEERKYKASIGVKVLGYLIGGDVNEEGRKVNVTENAVEVKIPRENIILQTDDKTIVKEISSSIGGGGNSGLLVGSGLAMKKMFIIGNDVDTQYVLKHNYNSRDLFIMMRENFGDYQKVEFFVLFQDNNTVIIDTGDPIPKDSYVIVLVG